MGLLWSVCVHCIYASMFVFFCGCKHCKSFSVGVCVLCAFVWRYRHERMCGEMGRGAQVCTFMKLMPSDLWKNVCTELRSFSASWRFSLSCRTCWEFFLAYMVKVLSSICTLSAWFASSSACILWYWALTRSFSSDTASCGEPRGWRQVDLQTHARTHTAIKCTVSKWIYWVQLTVKMSFVMSEKKGSSLLISSSLTILSLIRLLQVPWKI